MLKVDQKTLDEMESQHKGIIEQIMRFENAVLPQCPHCLSENTADVQVGVIGRTIYITTATSKFYLILNGPKPGQYYCNDCKQYFGEVEGPPGGFTGRPRDRSFQAYKEFMDAVASALGIKGKVSEESLLKSWRESWGFPPDTRPEDIP